MKIYESVDYDFRREGRVKPMLPPSPRFPAESGRRREVRTALILEFSRK